jgi:hypothetical protein
MANRFQQLYDGDAFEIDLKKKEMWRFACCDCGLVHNISLAIEDNGKLGIAIERNKKATYARRRTLKRRRERASESRRCA